MTGFEPAASCSRSKRATKLRYIPIFLVVICVIVVCQLALPSCATSRCFSVVICVIVVCQLAKLRKNLARLNSLNLASEIDTLFLLT